MAGHSSTDDQYNPYLSSTQQDLLLAALVSNNYSATNPNGHPQANGIKRSDSDASRERHLVPPPYVDGGLFGTTQDNAQQPGALANFDFDNTSPYLDYLDGDTSLNFDSNDLGGEDMFGSVPGPRTDSSDSDKGERSDKRKSPDEADDEDFDGDAKRMQGDDKMAKKPGRKPLTSEPTTKRKAQNRAAQRAFRERKEKHLKDLETRVEGLAKASEADKHENGLLRAQVERLQSELREYKKRMSMKSTGISQSPPSSSRLDSRSNSKPGSDFQFDFPRFGGLPGSQLFDNQSKRDNISPLSNGAPVANQAARQNSQARYPSPKSQSQSQNNSTGQSPASDKNSNNNSRSGSVNNQTNMSAFEGFNSTLPEMSPSLFTPSLPNGSGTGFGFANKSIGVQNVDHGGDSNSGISRAFRFNSGSASSNTASPSVSSLSQFNANSSCGTSPESTHDSPSADANKPKGNTYSFNSNPTTQNSFANPSDASANMGNPINDFSFDWLASQNGGQFDPVLFGDYRDSQDAVIGNGDFNNGFFNDAFPYDFGSPLNFDLNSPKQPQHPQPTVSASRNLLAEVEKARDGDDDDMPAHQGQNKSAAAQAFSQKNKVSLVQAEKMLNCNTIWSQVQSNPDFQDGKFDLDGLCAELRAKAKCSENGVTVPSEYVDAAFKKLGSAEPQDSDGSRFKQSTTGTDFLFQREYVDEALQRLGGRL